MSKILSYTIDANEFHRLEDVDRKFKELSKLLYENNPKFVTVTMIANAHGISRQDVLNKPWMLPNFGRIDGQESNRKRLWRFDEYLDWVAIPTPERRRMFKEHNDY